MAQPALTKMEFSNITEKTEQVLACVPDEVAASVEALLAELKSKYPGNWAFQATHKIHDRCVHHRFRRSILPLQAV